MQRHWRLREPADSTVVDQLTESLSIDPVLARLLVLRGVNTFEEARTFFRPSIDHLHDPMLMRDMDKAAERVEKALNSGEKILIYGDYDVDGTTAVTLVYSFLKQWGGNVVYYIPDRYEEGYGVSQKGVEYAHEEGVALIISLDCGIKAGEKIAYANEQGMDFIVCDHHLPEEDLPPALAVLDPKREDCDYPYTELSGCGIGFKLLQALNQRAGRPFSAIESGLDLVAVAIAADIVPITGENRILAYFGLKRINRHPRPGFKALVEVAQGPKELNVTDLVFLIAPRINAAGRMGHARMAVELMIAEDPNEAQRHGATINTSNEERKSTDEQITLHALELLEAQPNHENLKTTVLFDPEWHKGVIGIVASRLIEKHYKPTILFTRSKGLLTGSARSVRGFNLYQALEACSDLMVQFGGHKYAAGITLKEENFPAFKERFEQVVAESIEPEQLIPELAIDAELDLHRITPKFFRILKQFAPFGPGNMKPLFLTKGLTDTGKSRLVGATADHVKFEVHQSGVVQEGIGFSLGHHFDEVAKGAPFDMAHSLDENEWRGEVRLQLKVKDLRF